MIWIELCWPQSGQKAKTPYTDYRSVQLIQTTSV